MFAELFVGSLVRVCLGMRVVVYISFMFSIFNFIYFQT